MNNKGQNIIALFESIRTIFSDVKKIIELFDLSFKDSNFKLKWETSSITNGVSTSLSFPEEWILTGLYRIYTKNMNEIVGFNISFQKGIQEPIFIGGKIKYNTDSVKDWDLRTIWYDWEPKKKVFNGDVIHFEPHKIVDHRFEQIKIFAIPLTQIEDKKEIEKLTAKIIDL